MKFINDTGKMVTIHPATFSNGVIVDEKPIIPNEERLFVLPENTSPVIKMWDYGDKGLMILILPTEKQETKLNPKKKKKKPTLEELLAKITPENRHREIDFGIEGKELI